MSPIAPGSLVVVPGITGYIGSHVGLAVLQAGYRVRGVVREIKQAERLGARLKRMGRDAGKDRLEFVIVHDLRRKEQYLRAFSGASGVCAQRATWVEDSTASVLAAVEAAAIEQSIRRLVLTSSSAACGTPGVNVEHTLWDTHWNNDAVQKYKLLDEKGKEDPKNRMVLYCAAKTLSEQEAWKWIDEHRAPLELVTVMPAANFRPFLSGEPHSTGGWIPALLKGRSSFLHAVPSQWHIDVRDTSRLHILASSEEELAWQRISASAGPFGWNDVLRILKKHFPSHPVPDEDPNNPTGPQAQPKSIRSYRGLYWADGGR